MTPSQDLIRYGIRALRWDLVSSLIRVRLAKESETVFLMTNIRIRAVNLAFSEDSYALSEDGIKN